MSDFPLETDTLMSTLVALLSARGETKAVALIAAAHPELAEVGYDNWDGGTTFWRLALHVHPKFYVQVTEDDRTAVEATVKSTAKEIMKRCTGDAITDVSVSPQVVSSDWRADARAWLAGEGVNNQGRVRSNNMPSRERDGLLFRSEAEIRLYLALKARGVSFAPLPVFIRGGDGYRRIEPDFIVVRDRTMMAIEVDGDTTHHETPVEAHNRTKMLADEGVHIERVSAADCATDDAASACAGRLLAFLDKHAGRVVR